MELDLDPWRIICFAKFISASLDDRPLQMKWAMKIPFFMHNSSVNLWKPLPEIPVCLQSFRSTFVHDNVVGFFPNEYI